MRCFVRDMGPAREKERERHADQLYILAGRRFNCVLLFTKVEHVTQLSTAC